MYLQMSVLRRAHCYLMPSILAFIVQGSKKTKGALFTPGSSLQAQEF